MNTCLSKIHTILKLNVEPKKTVFIEEENKSADNREVKTDKDKEDTSDIFVEPEKNKHGSHKVNRENKRRCFRCIEAPIGSWGKFQAVT